MHKLPIHWLPGESAYSVAARAYLASPYQSWKITNLELFGRVDVRLNTMLPGHLNALATLVGRSVNELRIYGTGHPLVAFGLADKQTVMTMMQHELQGNADRVYEDSRLAASKLSFGHFLKGCPFCFTQDEAYYGIGYWHTIHQCHGMVVCPEHNLKLTAVKAGDGGVNHHYILPTSELLGETAAGNEAERNLSHYLMQLCQLLCVQTSIMPMPSIYKAWLDAKGYLTKAGRIRWRYLQPALQEYWNGLFNQQSPSLPLELSDFDFVPRLIHHATNVHYIKHALLMGFLSHTPSLFFCGPQREVKPVIIVAQRTTPKISVVLTLLDKGLSMRQAAKQLHCSIGYIKQLALREGREIERRRQFITPDMERAIWRKAFLGEHREAIAQSFNISTGAVEQIIQSHAGLSQWRHHLRMAKRKRQERKLLQSFIQQYPNASRTEIKTKCSAYMWLYKHDREWLYNQLPPAQPRHKKTPLNWEARDLVVLAQLLNLKSEYKSMSAIDRAVGGHSWLVKMRDKFPQSYAYALELLARQKHKPG